MTNDLQYGLATAFVKQVPLMLAFGPRFGACLAFGYYLIGFLIGGDD